MAVLVTSSPSLPQSTIPVSPESSPMREFTDLECAASSFVDLVASSSSKHSVRLHCTIPTWSASSELCCDLDGLHELHSRTLVFVHDLCRKLGAAGIQVSYRLAFSDTPVVLLRALLEDSTCSRDESDALELVKPSDRSKAIVTLLHDIPSIILT